MKLPGLFLKEASHARPFLTSALYSALFLPASSCLQLPSNPQPQAFPLQSRITPRPTALRENEVGGGGGGSLARVPALSPLRALAGPESGSTEVARPATPALSREAQPQSPPGLPDGTIYAPSGERGASEHRVPWKFSRWDCVGIFRFLKFQIGAQASPVTHAALARDFGLLVLFAAFFTHSHAMVQPGRRLGTIFGQGKAEEPFVPSGSAPPSFLRAPPTVCPSGSAGLTARLKTRLPSPALQPRAVP